MKNKGNTINRINIASTGKCVRFPIIYLNILFLKY